MRHTVRAIILKDKQVLLVTGHDANFYWTPGGGVEDSETIIQTLDRELKEELGIAVKSYTPYYSYEYEDQKVDNFLVTTDSDMHVGEEITGYTWYSSKSTEVPSNGFMRMTLPKLIQDNLID